MNFLFALLAASSGTFLLRFLVALHRESKAASRASVRVRFVGRDLPKAVGKIVALDRNFGQKSTRRLARKVVIGLLATTFLGLLLHAQDNPQEQPAGAGGSRARRGGGEAVRAAGRTGHDRRRRRARARRPLDRHVAHRARRRRRLGEGADRRGVEVMGMWVRAWMLGPLYEVGRWDDLLARADEVIQR